MRYAIAIIICIAGMLLYVYEPNRSRGIITAKYQTERWTDTSYFFILYDSTINVSSVTEVGNKKYHKYKIGDWFSNKFMELE